MTTKNKYDKLITDCFFNTTPLRDIIFEEIKFKKTIA